jgi:hypothetical protein
MITNVLAATRISASRQHRGINRKGYKILCLLVAKAVTWQMVRKYLRQSLPTMAKILLLLKHLLTKTNL